MDTTTRETELSKADETLADLLGLVACKNQTAMGELYDHTKHLVYGLVLRMLREQSAAEDITQDVYMQIWKKADTFDPARGSALAWIITISRSRALDKMRSSKALLRHENPTEELGNLLCSGPDPEHNSSLSERAQLVRRSLFELPPIQRTVIELAFFDGLTQSEIAGHTAIPLGTVKSRIRTGMKRLREELSVLDDQETNCRLKGRFVDTRVSVRVLL
jgi:RNA polymerase sigma-70 factor, ECF subfamily